MSSQERRGCRGCQGVGFVQVDAAYDYKTGELVKDLTECYVCRGWGSVPMFLYQPAPPRGKAEIRQLDDNAVWKLCWVGSARERKESEKELRRRGRRNR